MPQRFESVTFQLQFRVKKDVSCGAAECVKFVPADLRIKNYHQSYRIPPTQISREHGEMQLKESSYSLIAQTIKIKINLRILRFKFYARLVNNHPDYLLFIDRKYCLIRTELVAPLIFSTVLIVDVIYV